MRYRSWQSRAVEYFQKAGTGRSKAYYRCGFCRSRKVLNRELWEYIRPPKCNNCFKTDWRIDWSRSEDRRLKRGGYNICYCDALHYPHRKGSVDECQSG